MREVLLDVYFVLLMITMFFAAYYAFIGVIGLFVRKRKYSIIEDKSKFCIFVPCHNEETVVGATVENYAKIQYNPELFDIYFLADNCSDQTAEKAKEAIEKSGMKNFYVLERNVDDPTKKGKPHALNWGIQTLEAEDNFYNKYDMFMILDADNFVDAEILRHVNSQYWSIKEKKRPVMIQTYLDSKNKNNIIARGYFAAYRCTNGFFQLPRYRLGLVPAIGGTGFAMTTGFLKELGGFTCKSLTEDLEIQTIATLKGKRIAYNHYVRIYDEKPTGLKQSAVQKTRWAQGHWYVFFKYGWRMFLHMFHPKEIKLFFKRFDNFVYLSSMAFMLLSWIVMFFSIGFFIVGERGFSMYIPSIILSAFSILLFPISALLDGTKEEKRRVLIDFFPNLLGAVIHTVIYFYANIMGLLHCGNQKVWRKTAHKVTTMNATDVEKTADEATEEATEEVTAIEATEETASNEAEVLQEAAVTENEAE